MTTETIRTGKAIEVLPKGTISQKTTLKDLTESGVISKLTPDLTPAQVDQAHVKGRQGFRKAKKIRKVKVAADYIPYDDAMRVGQDLLWSGKQATIGFYIIFSVNTGLRVGDVLRMKHSDLIDKVAGDVLRIQEQKTSKIRDIQLNDKIVESYKYLYQHYGHFVMTDYIFRSQKGTVYATISLNRILKNIFAGYAPNISTHSLRKSFGRRVYDMNRQSEHSLVLLSDIFAHSSLTITRRYLGLRKEEIANVYLTL
jgi:integrase